MDSQTDQSASDPSDSDEDDGYFGQQEVPLTYEIKEILDEYPDGQIFKEIIQNADDAKAKEVKFFIDERSHGQQNLLHPSLAKFQGPSLLAYNDAVFTKEDWKNIQKLKRSDKRSDPFKVGKFGIGFNSVFHVTDLPTIISGEWICYMDPQKRIWKREPGHRYKLTNNKPENNDSFAPFKFIDSCSLGSKHTYPGTMIRLPLRSKPSGLSSILYDIAKLKVLLNALKDDADILLLFLRYIEKIEVFLINDRGNVGKIFSVTHKAIETIRALKSKFFSQVKEYYGNPNALNSLPQLQYEVTIVIHDVELRSLNDFQWVITQRVGSDRQEILSTSKKVCSLPWIGVAISPNAQCSSRLFCFLPMPDSEEVNPPLPACVHGTFGLTKDRRHFKWGVSDMKNDNGALWNNLLLSSMLPFCYAYCIGMLKNKCNQDKFYAFWPSVSSVKRTNWKIILKPLLSYLLQDQLIWSQNGKWVKLQSSVYVVPQMNSGQLPQVVINALIRCGKVVVVLADRVWEAVMFIYPSTRTYPFTTITPSLVRHALKGNSAVYTNMSRTKQFELLHYCIEDEDYCDLPGLVLLPLVNGTFTAFRGKYCEESVYICDKDFLDTKLLANNEVSLVNIEEEESDLHHKLIEIANNNCTQLNILTTKAFAMMLKQLSPFKKGWCCYGASDNFYNETWLKTFWKWVKSDQLYYFIDIPLLPICNGKTSKRFNVVPLQIKSKSQVIEYNILDPKLIDAVAKLGCSLTCSQDFKFLYYISLSDYVHDLTPSSVLSITSQMFHQNVTFTQKEAKVLRDFIFQYPHTVLSSKQKYVLLKLCIFPSIQSIKLHSLQDAETTVAEKSGAMIVVEPGYLEKYKFCIPPSPLLLTCDTNISINMQAMLPRCSWLPTKLEIILHVILQKEKLTERKVIKLTSIILEPIEYYSLVYQPEGGSLIAELQSLKFVPTCTPFNKLVSPSEVYDPRDHIVKELFKRQNVFPVAPFGEKYFDVLKKLGMKTSENLDVIDIRKVIQLICSQIDIEAETARAHKVLEYLSSSKGNAMLTNNHKNPWLSKVLTTSPWLPVMVTPPKDYPAYFDWKGTAGKHFVSAQHIHASSVKGEHQKLPYLIGSQIKVLQYDGTLTHQVITSLGISQCIPMNAVVQQLFDLISRKKFIEKDKFDHCIRLLYDHLQSEVETISNQLLQTLKQSKVVQVSEDKFVQPSVVACSFDDKLMTLGKLEPYIYCLPIYLQNYGKLFYHIGAKRQVNVNDVLSILRKIAHNQSTNDWNLTISILKWLCNNFTSSELKELHSRIFVPVDGQDIDDKLLIKPADQVAYLDKKLQWLKRKKGALNTIMKGYSLVHPSISNEMAGTLQLKPLNTMIANTEEFCFEQAGQSEPLTTRLNRILREYKDTSVIQELLQNADDAGATEVALYYDTREHDSSNLFFPGMANSYGPALLFYNNAEFTREDFENIRKISGETKKDKPLKIGKFGVGFCSVYHITDVPSFVSGEYFVVFDPTLQYLREEIENEFNPGIKVNYCENCFLKASDQFAPYVGIHGFDHNKPFKGTLFRLPLRFMSSQISKNTWYGTNLLSIIDSVKHNAPKLLMFLNNVKKISFHQSHGNNFRKIYAVTATKTDLANISENSLTSYKVFSPQFSDCKEENWIIATNCQRLELTSNYTQHGTASVSVRLKTDVKTHLQCVDVVKGECFCYLPLHMETGLPVHVSSNFAVMTNRRGLWKADNDSTATKESNWNIRLMKSVVFQAYIALLLHLKQKKEDGELMNYNYYDLWPVQLKEMVPWENLLNKLYNSILSSEYPLLYSKIGGWKCLNECKFLSPDILSASFENELQLAIHKVTDILKLPVVDFPDAIWNKLSPRHKFKSCVIDEEQFLIIFYDDNTLSKVPVKHKTIIVKASLIVFANNQHGAMLPELMQLTKCIPCSPNGIKFNKPQNIVDSESPIAVLFDPSECMHPDAGFLTQSNLLHQSLVDLGIMQSLPWKLIIDRARNLHRISFKSHEERVAYLRTLVSCIKENLSNKSLPPSNEDKNTLRKVAFLPVMQKPTDYLTCWKGDTILSSCGPKLTKHTDSLGAINAIYACGSQIFILDTDIVSTKYLTREVMDFLGIRRELEASDVANQFLVLLEWFQNVPVEKQDQTIYKFVNVSTSHVYKYWGKNIANDHLSVELLSNLMKNKHCIWNGSKFLHPSTVSFKWPTDGPLLYKPPVHIPLSMQPVIKHLGMEDEFSVGILVTTLGKMKQLHKDTPLTTDCQEIVNLILPKITNAVNDDAEIFLPDEKFVLRRAKELKYNDAPWCKLKENYLYCHKCVSRETALSLGAEPVRNVLLQDFEITEDDLSEDFGQEEKLTQRLNNILRDYPKDITFIKEILQNADDAKATRLYFILDKRYHSEKEVISEPWKKLQGPALLIWNDSTFDKDDIHGIQSLGLGSKTDDANKIGHYGIGFSVVYHFTDCPSFVTDNKLCILDPHYHYIAHKKLRPGKMFKNFNELLKRFPSMKSPYLLNDKGSISQEIQHKGTLFRLPLRLTQEMAEISDFTKDTISLEKLEEDLEKWISEVSEALLFLCHVKDVRFFVVNEGRSWFDLQIKLQSVIKVDKTVHKINGNSKLVFYPMTLFSKEDKKTEWLVQLGEGDFEDPEFNWDEVKPPNTNIHPHHGIAVPKNVDDFEAKSFCFLPLPGETNLPIHVHGHFILHSDRRGHWVSSSVKSKAKTSKDDDNVSMTASDPKAVWNKLLLKAISVSYAHFLILHREETIGTKERLQKVLHKFYECFPTLSICSEPWLSFAKQLYVTLHQINAPILAKLIQHNTCGIRNGKQNFAIRWYKLYNPNSPDECFFKSYFMSSDLYNALTSVGMNLINTPYRICKQFRNADTNFELPEVSNKSVLKYYSEFCDLIYNQNPLPCLLSLTKFKSLDCFVVILKYLMQHDCVIDDEDSKPESIIMKDYSMLGLIVTADENLHSLSDSKCIISSVFWNLFPQCKHTFINESLLEDYPYDSDYLLFNSCSSKEQLRCILSVIASSLPLSWSDRFQATQAPIEGIKVEWIKKLLQCLMNDLVFSKYYDDILMNFALLPATDNMLYSASSKLLPLKSVSTDDSETISTDDLEATSTDDSRSLSQYAITDIKKLMTKLKVPLFRHDILDDFKETRKVQLPSILNDKKILESLFLIKNLNMCIFQTLNKNELILLFGLLKSISYSSSIYQKYIKSLPIFTTIDKKLVGLSWASEVIIWDENEVCAAGIDRWINCISTTTVFLSPTAPWSCLKHEAENLQMSNINKYDVYCKYIFPNFHLLDKAEQLCQLRFIKQNIYPECKFFLDKEYGYKDGINKVETFVRDFKSLECILDNTGNLRTIQFFYDHNEILFKAFCRNSHFLPSELRATEWLEFLKYFGLKSTPTRQEFIAFCTMVSKCDNIPKLSSILLEALFYIPPLGTYKNKYEEIHSSLCLQQVSQIPIAIVQDVPELNSIKAQKLDNYEDHNSTFTLTKLSGSSLLENKHLVWTVRPLIKLSYNENSQMCLNRLEDLGVIRKPTVEDVILNLKNLSTTTMFASFPRFTSKELYFMHSSSHLLLPEIVVTMLQYIQTELLKHKTLSFEEACDQLQHHNLSNINLLPVRVHGNDTECYALAMPMQVLNIQSSDISDIDAYYPFLHPLIDKASSVVHFLSNIGVQKTLNFSHIQYILHVSKSRFQENEVDSETMLIINKATTDLVNLLQSTQIKGNNDIVQYLQPLFLLSEDHVLTECSKLVVYNISGKHKFPLPSGYAYLHPLGKFHLENALLYHLPEQMGLLSLRLITHYEMVNNKPVESVFSCISVIEEILKSSEFTQALLMFSNYCTHGNTPDSSVINILTKFQSSLTVQYLDSVQVKPNLVIDDEVIAVSKMLFFSFYIERIADQWTLSLKNTESTYPLHIFLLLGKQICSKLKLKDTGYFNVTDNDDLPDLATFVGLVLQCNSISSIGSVIKEYFPSAQSEMIASDDELSVRDEHSLDPFSPEELMSIVNEQGEETISYTQMLQKVADRFIEWHKSEPPQIDLCEAKIWIQQAEYDHGIIWALMNNSETDENQHCAHICFMCQQVAEKSLKAGMYAKCGVKEAALHTHNLMCLAKELGASTINDHEVAILNGYYLPTRYPNCHNPSDVPGDKFSTSEAKRAFEMATRIFKAIQGMINDAPK